MAPGGERTETAALMESRRDPDASAPPWPAAAPAPARKGRDAWQRWCGGGRELGGYSRSAPEGRWGRGKWLGPRRRGLAAAPATKRMLASAMPALALLMLCFKGRCWVIPVSPSRLEITIHLVTLLLVLSPHFLKNTQCSPCGVLQKQHTELIHVEES